ncbi:alginate lyase family protein [Histidinibacterium lentulum]|uniref:Alginate lyase n=1 Tax=Histidinibacterium lentulum TaxID=2480588 RepID=A0A3N2R866_9RHOB|nr:alginate lyase family protein [Histidinibacterium lentulum]ROU03627.1 alginate lyase [Histidinibacterium lentulum]
MTMTTRALPLLAVGLAAMPAVLPAQTGEAQAEACIDVPEPVISLAYGSRYTDESEDRSDLDAESNAAVNEALGPIDDFIVDLASTANDAVEGGAGSVGDANCVAEAILVWAEADALSDLQTMNAQISSPSRLGGIALAYLQVAPLATALSAEDREVIEGWFRERAAASAAYFDEEAPPGASRNNLRAWAGLAAAAAGLAARDEDLLDWAAGTVELVACEADADGALPLEMGRGNRALHYHLHAVAPLVVTSALLRPEGYDLFEVCDGAVRRVAEFVPAAFADPDLAEEKAGEPQTFFAGDDDLQSYELAWAEAYLSLFEDADLAAFVEEFRPLGHSKLGGSQDILW